jgi:4-methyl-5(b-hydroxyethyl)-thiazole monophosphate biosynthesis
MLRGKRAVCFPGFEGYLEGYIPSDARAIRDGNVITAVGMGAAFEFGILIVAALKGDEVAASLAASALLPDSTK